MSVSQPKRQERCDPSILSCRFYTIQHSYRIIYKNSAAHDVNDPLFPPPAPGPPAIEARARLVALSEVLLCSSVPTQLAISAVLALAGWQPITAAPDGSTQYSFGYVLALTLGDTVILVALMIWFMRARGESARALWLGTRRRGREVLLGLALVPILFVGVVVLLNGLRLLFPGLHNVATNPLERFASGGGVHVALFALVAIVAGGIREELQRAFLLHRFEHYLGGATVGVIVVSVGFGLGHLVQGWDAAIATGVMGAFWAVLYLDRRSSVAPVVSHAGFNTFEILRIALLGGG